MDDDELRALLSEVYAGAPWVDQARILAEVRDPGTPWDEAVRYYLNSPAGGASCSWSRRAGPSWQRPRDIPDGARIALGFDGSHSHDGTALVACDDVGAPEPRAAHRARRPRTRPSGPCPAPS